MQNAFKDSLCVIRSHSEERHDFALRAERDSYSVSSARCKVKGEVSWREHPGQCCAAATPF